MRFNPSRLILAGLCLLCVAASPIRIEPNVAQLFVDDWLIESQSGLKRTLHQPKKDNGGNEPVIAITDEFDGAPATLQANGTIVFDPKLKKWVMIANGSLSRKGPERSRRYRFTSDDAMHWTRGDDGKPQPVKFDLTDPAGGRSAARYALFSFCYDKADPDHPYKGWQWVAGWGKGLDGAYYVSSRDGRQWECGPQVMRKSGRTIEQDSWKLIGPNDVTLFYHDTVSGKFLAMMKFVNDNEVGNGNSQRSRAYLFLDRLDEPVDLKRLERVALVPPASEKDGDHEWDEYYASTAWRYGSLWLGGLKVWHSKGDYPCSAAGSAYLKLVVSHDGLNWSKVRFNNDEGVPEVWIPNGPEGGNGGKNDGGYMTEFSQGPIRIGDELIYYYGSTSLGKNHPDGVRVSGGGVFRARLRLDGFVSVDAGTLTTKPLTLEDSKLVVNGIGPITVEVLADNEQVLVKKDVAGDSLAHEVGFNKAPGAARLRFTIGDGGKLYSFSTR